MNTKKKVVCTVLFVVIMFALFIGSYFIRNEDLSLYDIIVPWICGSWIYDKTIKFYEWLSK